MPKIKNIELVSSTVPGPSLYKTFNRSFISKAGHDTASYKAILPRVTLLPEILSQVSPVI